MSKKKPDRANALTQEAVNKACQELAAKGVTPTLDSVRAELGGSYSTLGPMVKNWRASQQAEAQTLFEMPESAMTAVRSLAAEMWRLASMEAVRRVESAEANAEEQIKAARSDTEELVQIVESMENEAARISVDHDRLQQELAKVGSERDELYKVLTRKEVEIEALRAQANRSEARNEALQKELIALAKAGISGPDSSA